MSAPDHADSWRPIGSIVAAIVLDLMRQYEARSGTPYIRRAEVIGLGPASVANR